MYRPLLVALVAILCLTAVTPRMLTADDTSKRPIRPRCPVCGLH